MVPLSTVIRAARHNEPLKQQLGPIDGLVFEMAQGPANAPMAWGMLAGLLLALMFVGGVRLSVPSSIKVASEPTGAEVVVDGVSRGIAPVQLKDLSHGRHTVELKAAEYQTKTLSVDIGAFAQTSYRATLSPMPKVVVQQEEKPQTLGEIFATKAPEPAKAKATTRSGAKKKAASVAGHSKRLAGVRVAAR
jgi:hypothetical protein